MRVHRGGVRARVRRLAAAFGAVALGCAPSAPGAASVEEAVPSRPSLVLVSIDSLRADHVGAYGYGRATTPAFDRLAAQGWLFERAYTTVPWTLPAHMSLLTGLYPSQHGVAAATRALGEGVPTLAERLAAAGYRTLGFHDPAWLDPAFGFGRGFDVYRPHADASEADRHVRAALAERDPSRPFFLFVHFYDVHTSAVRREGWTLYDPPPPYDRMFLEDARARLADLDVFELWRDVTPRVSESQGAAIEALYDGGIRYVDDVLGGWLADWERSGLLEHAVVVVTADHGEGLGQRAGDRYGGHGGLFEEGLHVPLVIRLPGGRYAGEREPRPVSHVDLVPTLLDALGLPPDPGLPGSSLLRGRPEERPILAEDGHTRASLRWPWKVVSEGDAREGLVFDLEEDPGEARPLAARVGAQRARELAAPVLEAAGRERAGFADVPPARPIEPEAALRGRLGELGYGGDG